MIGRVLSFVLLLSIQMSHASKLQPIIFGMGGNHGSFFPNNPQIPLGITEYPMSQDLKDFIVQARLDCQALLAKDCQSKASIWEIFARYSNTQYREFEKQNTYLPKHVQFDSKKCERVTYFSLYDYKKTEKRISKPKEMTTDELLAFCVSAEMNILAFRQMTLISIHQAFSLVLENSILQGHGKINPVSGDDVLVDAFVFEKILSSCENRCMMYFECFFGKHTLVNIYKKNRDLTFYTYQNELVKTADKKHARGAQYQLYLYTILSKSDIAAEEHFVKSTSVGPLSCFEQEIAELKKALLQKDKDLLAQAKSGRGIDQEVSKLRKKLEAEKKKVEAEKEKTRQAEKGQRTQKGTISRFHLKSKKLEAELEGLKEELEEAQSSYEELQENLETISAEKAALVKNLKAAKKASHKKGQKFVGLNKDLGQLTKKNKSLSSRIEKAKASEKTALQTVEKFKASEQDRQQQIQKLEKEIAFLKANANDLTAKLETKTEAKPSQTLSDAISEIIAFRTANRVLENSQHHLRTQLEQLGATYNQLLYHYQQLQASRQQPDQLRIKQLEEKVNKLIQNSTEK